MSTVTSQNKTAPVVRQYEIGGVREIVKRPSRTARKKPQSRKSVGCSKMI